MSYKPLKLGKTNLKLMKKAKPLESLNLQSSGGVQADTLISLAISSFLKLWSKIYNIKPI